MQRTFRFCMILTLQLALAGGVYAQCNVLPGETATVTTPVSCGQMNIAGTLIIESTGSITGGDESTLNGSGATITVNGGAFTINGRFNVGQGSDGYINLNGGTFTVTGTWKYPDDPGGVHRMWINNGVVHSGDIELRGDRDAIIYIGGGSLRLDSVGTGGAGDYYDPTWWLSQGWLQPAENYDQILIQDLGSYTEITGVSLYPKLQFETPSSEALEAVSPAVLAVTISEAPTEQVTVSYSVVGGTATQGDDFTLSGSTLTFESGQTTPEYISINIIDDELDEDDETIVLALSNPVGGDAMLGATSQHTYTIIDPRPAVQFAAPASGGLESVTPVSIPVELSAPVSGTVTTDYAVTGGTATRNVDYTLTDGTVQFESFDTTENIDITVHDDIVTEEAETIRITLSNVVGPDVRLASPSQHTYTIADDDAGLRWDGLTWFYSDNPDRLFVNGDGDLEWNPEKGGQFITRLPDEPLSQTGDVVEISYYWLTDGAHSCPDCFACPDGCYDDDITCIAGTSDMRVGLFEADGEWITSDGFDTSSSVFVGYKGYQFRFGPNMLAGPTRWVDCTGEVHKTGQVKKKDVSLSDLLSKNDHPKLRDLPGFELPPGEWTLFTMRLERLSSSDVDVSMTFNDQTYGETDDSSSGQPQKIDVLAVHMRNGRPYSRLVLGRLCQPPPGDATDDCVVNLADLKVLTEHWPMERCRDGAICGDLDGDSRTNYRDYCILASHWLEVDE